MDNNIVKCEECTFYEERLIHEIYKMFQISLRGGVNIYKELRPNQTTFVIFDVVSGLNIFKCNIFLDNKDRITGYIYDNNYSNWDFYILRVHDNVFTYYAEQNRNTPKCGIVPSDCAKELKYIISNSFPQVRR